MKETIEKTLGYRLNKHETREPAYMYARTTDYRRVNDHNVELNEYRLFDAIIQGMARK